MSASELVATVGLVLLVAALYLLMARAARVPPKPKRARHPSSTNWREFARWLAVWWTLPL